MMRADFSGLLLLALACNDTEVTDKVAEVLVHGALAAQAKCDFDPPSIGVVSNPSRLIASGFNQGDL